MVSANFFTLNSVRESGYFVPDHTRITVRRPFPRVDRDSGRGADVTDLDS